MRWRWKTFLLLGLGLSGLGVLWFVQGSDLLHIEPVLCAADCEPLVGHQPLWQLVGAATFIAGGLASTTAVRKLRR
jgi:hypothetical protein